MRARQVHAVTDSGGDGPVVVPDHGLGGDQAPWAPVVPLEAG